MVVHQPYRYGLIHDKTAYCTGDSWDEENWRAQYGQVINSSEEPTLEVPCTDLWDWTMVTKPRKDGKGVIAKLVGRLMKRSSKLHPSMPSGGGLLRTAPICEAHLDLVRVTTGLNYPHSLHNLNYPCCMLTSKLHIWVAVRCKQLLFSASFLNILWIYVWYG